MPFCGRWRVPSFPLAGIIPCSNADRRGGSGDEIEKGLVHIDTEKRVKWHQIRAEYISGVSQRSLAEKYHVSRDTIARHCRLEKWTEKRKGAEADITQSIIQKTAEAAADNATIAANIKRKGLLLLERLFDDYAQHTATEHRESNGGIVDVKRLRDLTAAYKDLTGDIVQSDTDNALLQSLMDLERGRQ